MFARTKVAVAAYPQTAERLAAQLTDLCAHFRGNYMELTQELLG
jgi:hypothetical protein